MSGYATWKGDAEAHPGLSRRDIAQGRCLSCGMRHTWPRKRGPKVSEAKCPDCGFDLYRTTRELRHVTVKHWPHGLGVTVGDRSSAEQKTC